MIVTKQRGTYGTNVVEKETLEKYQLSVLKTLKDILSCSFGPYGSNTCIKREGSLNEYTKDGHTILSNIKFTGIIEESIRSDIETITTNIANTVGDGTTSAVIVSYYLFKNMLDSIMEFGNVLPTPYTIREKMQELISRITDEIRKTAKPATVEDIYDIALISANDNKEIANIIKSIYEQCGMDVFIDVAMSPASETILKFFDGMTLNTGYADASYVNMSDNTCTIPNPNIYFFEDPIDTMEMGTLFNAIIEDNIVKPYNSGDDANVIPTVIVAPKITRDVASNLDRMTEYQSRLPREGKLPLLIITDTHQIEELIDICRMCDAKPIRKYIDASIYKADVEAGLAPTRETVAKSWCGSAESVIADSVKTKFINPMHKRQNENGEYTDLVYTSLLTYLESTLAEAKKNGDDAHTIGTLKRRINSLKSNMVEIHVGGMTMADRDSARHLMEDAVKNCRSAAANGIGWGANHSAYSIITKIMEEEYFDKNGISTYIFKDKDGYNDPKIVAEGEIITALFGAYNGLIGDLYKVSGINDDEISPYTAYKKGCPLNIRTMEYDGKVKSSIESDIIILESVSKIIGIMVTCNQFLTPNPQMNVYSDLKEVDKEVNFNG